MSVKDYLNETRSELNHTSWPTRKQAFDYTLLVIGISVATSSVLFLCDSVFLSALKFFIER